MIALPCLPALHVGDDADCRRVPKFAGTLHAAKYPCHANATGLPGKGDARYLTYRVSDAHLTLNMIDPPTPLFSVELFRRALDFLDERLALGPVLIHCNQGFSRAPSLALVYLAKRTAVIAGDEFLSEPVPQHAEDLLQPADYATARAAFEKFYPAYAPGAGLVTFLTEHWKEIA